MGGFSFTSATGQCKIGQVNRYYYNEEYPVRWSKKNTAADAIRVHLPKASFEFMSSGEVTNIQYNRFTDMV
jgi:hypothetical protein